MPGQWTVTDVLIWFVVNVINPVAWGGAWLLGRALTKLGVFTEDQGALAWAAGWIALAAIMFLIWPDSWVGGDEPCTDYSTGFATGC